MNTHVRPPSGAYAIQVQPLDDTATARFGDIVLARSSRARVMYETRLTPTVFFPREDVLVPLSDETGFQTFCPFKGTATYHDVLLPGETLEKAVWCYDRALPESTDIEGYVGFMPSAGVTVDTGAVALEQPDDGNINGPLVDWLLREAWACKTPEILAQTLAEKMKASGIAVSRMSILIWSLHPQIAGKNYLWTHAAGEVTTYAPSYEIYDHPGFINSPLRHVSRGLGGVRQKIGVETEQSDFPVIDDLRAEGATDYVAMPLPFSDGQMNVMTLASDHPDGFTTANLGLIFECLAIIGRYFEVFNQHENARTLLETYVGPRAGARVLGGEIRRGDGDEIDAAIMFSDLRASTRLETQLGREAFLTLLNRFFETNAEAVAAHGGEVLKFIGDAVLAVFPAGDDPDAARRNGLAAAQDILAGLERLAAEMGADLGGVGCNCAIGIAYGRVMYGNIGSRDRLDFTVIGHAANVAARLGDHGKTVGHRVVVTDDFDHDGMIPLGQLNLHNVTETVDAFALPERC